MSGKHQPSYSPRWLVSLFSRGLAMNDLVVKLRSTDDTGPGMNSARKGMASLAEAGEQMAQRITRSIAKTSGTFGFAGLAGASGAASRRMVAEAPRTGSTDDVETMNRRIQLVQRSQSQYERSTSAMIAAVQRLAIAEEDAAEQSSQVIQRKVTQEEQLLNRQSKRITSTVGAVNKQNQFAIQQSVFGLDDAITGYMNNGFKGAMIGAGNNATMVASMLGGVSTQLALIGGMAAIQIGMSLYNNLKKSQDGAKLLREELEGVQGAVRKMGDGKVSLRHIDSEIGSASSEQITRMQTDARLTVTRSAETIAALEQQLSKAESLQAQADTKGQRAGTGMQFNSEDERRDAAKSARQEAEAIRERITTVRNNQREALEFLKFTKEKNSIGVATAREEAEAAKERRQAEEKTQREQQQRDKLLDKQRKELDQLRGKQNRFVAGLFGDEGSKEAILAELDGRLAESRTLFREAPGMQGDAETMASQIAEEKLAKLALADRAKSRDSQNPALALTGSDRARQIMLGAGNQLTDARAKEDKHRSAMEQLTADVRDGIKELVAQAREDIEVVVAAQ